MGCHPYPTPKVRTALHLQIAECPRPMRYRNSMPRRGAKKTSSSLLIARRGPVECCVVMGESTEHVGE